VTTLADPSVQASSALVRGYRLPCLIPGCMDGGPVGFLALIPTPELPSWVATSVHRPDVTVRRPDAEGAALWALRVHLTLAHPCDVGSHELRAQAAAAEVGRAVCGRDPDPRPGGGECVGCRQALVRAGDRWLDPAGTTVCQETGHPCGDLWCAQHATGSRPDCPHCQGRPEVYDGHVPMAQDITPAPAGWHPPRRAGRARPARR
jgi:hypothetical protein